LVELKLNISKMKYLLQIVLIIMASISLIGQDTFTENFDSNILSPEWDFPHGTYVGDVAEGALQVEYNRSDDSWIWDQFNLQLNNSINIKENPFLRIKVRSDKRINLVLKPENTSSGSDWLEKTIDPSEEWQELFYELSNSATLPIKALYIYMDPGTTTEKSAHIEIDEIAFGGNIIIPLNADLLEQAIEDAINLSANLSIGFNDGENVPEDKTYLDSIIGVYHNYIFDIDAIDNQEIIDSLAYALYDICTHTEQKTFYDIDRSSVDDSLVYSARILLENLNKMKGPRFLYGMHDPTGYGVNWRGDDDRSDVQDVTGSYPAFFSWDANEIVDDKINDRLSYRVKTSHDLGVVTSFCWHQNDPEGVSFYSNEVSNPNTIGRSLLPGNQNNEFYVNKLQNIANYLKSTRGSNGKSIPVVFRPYHEHNGWWFWWGSSMPEQDYIDLWHYTVDYLKDSLDVHNLIYSFSPDGGQISTTKPYTYRYPGDDYVDVLGLDYYFDSGTDLEIERFIGYVESTVLLADSLGKVAAVTEIGDRNALSISKWHTKVVLDPIRDNAIASKIAYVSTWRNSDPDHHFAPYPGHSSVPDFLEFYSDTTTIFLNNMVKGISDSLYTSKLNEKSDAAFLFNYKLKNGPLFTIQDSIITYGGPITFNYTNATAIFNYSQLAEINIDGDEQVSDSSKVNLSLPTIYTVQSENGKVSRDYEVVIDELITATQELSSTENIEIDIYPLPAREFLNITSAELIRSIDVLSGEGRRILQINNVNARKYQLNNLSSGVIILNIQLKNGQSINKRVIVH